MVSRSTPENDLFLGSSPQPELQEFPQRKLAPALLQRSVPDGLGSAQNLPREEMKQQPVKPHNRSDRNLRVHQTGDGFIGVSGRQLLTERRIKHCWWWRDVLNQWCALHIRVHGHWWCRKNSKYRCHAFDHCSSGVTRLCLSCLGDRSKYCAR